MNELSQIQQLQNVPINLSVVFFIIGLFVTNIAALIGFFVSLKVTQAVQAEKQKYQGEQITNILSHLGLLGSKKD